MDKNIDLDCLTMDQVLEEQNTLEAYSPTAKKSLKTKRLGKTEEKLSTKLDTFSSCENFFNIFPPQVKTHDLHPDNPYNIDLTKPMAVQDSHSNSIFRDHRSFTQDSEECSYEEITSQLEPVPLVMDTCYSHFERDSSNSIGGSPHDNVEPVWLNSPAFLCEYAYGAKGLFDQQDVVYHPAACLLNE